MARQPQFLLSALQLLLLNPSVGNRVLDLQNSQTSLTPPATGSSFLELLSPPASPKSSTIKLTCSVFGSRALPHSVPFSPQARLSCEVKLAPFASSHKRRGYVRDHRERDLSVQLVTALDRYPKSGIDVFITVGCEGEAGAATGVSNYQAGGKSGGGVEVGLLGVLAGAITCASAAIADAGIECLDLVSGGVAALVRKRGLNIDVKGSEMRNVTSMEELIVVQDPSPEEHAPGDIVAACAVGYMAAREELTELWMRGSVELSIDDEDHDQDDLDRVIEGAIMAATETRRVLNEAVAERLLYAIKSQE